MQIDKYGQMIFDENDLCDLYLKNPDTTLDHVYVENAIHVSDVLSLDNLPKFIKYIDPNISVEEFDKQSQNNWNMPDEYKSLDIAEYVLSQCNNEYELQRAGQELLMFQERDLFPLLQYLKYLVDIMRKNNIVWGVGRGSSVSSFVLYLIGIHKINSLYYDLSIEEFLK